MKVLIALLLLVTASGCKAVASYPAGTATPLSRGTLIEACTRLEDALKTELNCAALPPPMVVVSSIVPAMAGPFEILYGLYFDDEHIIYISDEMGPEKKAVVIMHETIHYILSMVGLSKTIGNCKNEELAHILSGEPWGDNERSFYNCDGRVSESVFTI